MMSLVIIITAVVLLLVVALTKINKKSDVPGPFPFPIIGNLHLLTQNMHKDLKELSKTYGDVFEIYFGSKRHIVVNGVDAIREVLITNGLHFAGRPYNYKHKVMFKGCKNMFSSDYGPYWQHLRKLFCRGLNLYSCDRTRTSRIIRSHSMNLMNQLSQRTNEACDISIDIKQSLINVLMSLVFNQDVNLNDIFSRNILCFITTLSKFNERGPEDAFEFLQSLPTNVRNAIRTRNRIWSMLIEEHHKTYKHGDIRDITDALLVANSEMKEDFMLDMDCFLMIVDDMFSFGLEATANTLIWAIIFLAKWPDEQKRLRHELVRVDKCTYEELRGLPYMQAVINETQRLATVVPIAFHKATVNTKISNFYIDKDTSILINFYGITNDEKIFEKPNEFCPDRWLTNINGFQDKLLTVLPFGAGPRACPAQQLAMEILMSFLYELVKHFRFEEVDGSPNSIDGDLGLTVTPRHMKIRLNSVNGVV